MRGILYKDVMFLRGTGIVVAIILAALTTLMVVEKSLIWIAYIYIVLMVFSIPTSLVFDERKTKLVSLYQTFPINKTTKAKLRFAEFAGTAAVLCVVLEAAVSVINAMNGDRMFNMNNIVLVSLIMALMILGGIWLMMSFLIESSNVVLIIMSLTAGMAGGIMSFMDDDFIRLNFAHPIAADKTYVLLQNMKFHIVLWVVCILMTVLFFLVSCIACKRKNYR